MTYDIKDLYVCQYTNTRNTNNQKINAYKGKQYTNNKTDN
jgi:hypothetical protein